MMYAKSIYKILSIFDITAFTQANDCNRYSHHIGVKFLSIIKLFSNISVFFPNKNSF